MKKNDEIRRLFKLYLENKTNVHQEEILFRHLNENKDKDDEFDELMANAWQDEPGKRDDSFQATENLKQIRSRLQQKKQVKTNHYLVLKYAASAILVISAALGWFNYKRHQAGEVRTIELISKITGRGEKVKLLLPDSSVVYLGSMSKLTWPARFVKGSHRNIQLKGEAFFQVKRDTTSPFIVSSGKMQTQVLGTSFNIYAYPEDQEFSVTVRTGKVRVSENIKGKPRTLSLLTPGMKLVYEGDSRKFAVKSTRVDDVNSWTENRFIFRNEKLADILEKLERYYDVHFDLKAGKLAACRFNATFSNKSIKDVMEQLRIMSANHMKYKINSNHTIIALWGEGCE